MPAPRSAESGRNFSNLNFQEDFMQLNRRPMASCLRDFEYQRNVLVHRAI
jgi:hypothetical protein